MRGDCAIAVDTSNAATPIADIITFVLIFGLLPQMEGHSLMAPHCSEIGDQSVSWLTRGDMFWTTRQISVGHCRGVAAVARQAQAPALGRCTANSPTTPSGVFAALAQRGSPPDCPHAVQDGPLVFVRLSACIRPCVVGAALGLRFKVLILLPAVELCTLLPQ